mgnify:CR=1 FL=1
MSATTAVTVNETTLSTRSRNLALVWSTAFRNDRNTVTDLIPDKRGGLATIEAELARCRRHVSGGAYYGIRLWVGDQVVITGIDEDGYILFPNKQEIGWLIDGLRDAETSNATTVYTIHNRDDV